VCRHVASHNLLEGARNLFFWRVGDIYAYPKIIAAKLVFVGLFGGRGKGTIFGSCPRHPWLRTRKSDTDRTGE